MKKRVALCNIKRDDKVKTYSSRLSMPIRGVAFVLFGFALSACGSGERNIEDEGDVLLAFGDAKLTLQDVLNRIPVGIDPEDSASMFQSITDNWLKTQVLTELAESKLPDVRHIDRQVEAYRNRLIVTEYLRKMKEGKHFHVSDDSVRSFYDKHRGELLTEMPLVKGIYLKVSSSCSGVSEIRKLMADATGESIDRLEKSWLGDAIQYDYFESNWIDWQTIADQIPYRFYDPDAFLASTKNFETSYNGSTYFLHITDYLPSGSEQPYEFAAAGIAEMMERTKISNYEEALVNSLVTKALKDNRLMTIGYDPLTHRVKSRPKIKENKNQKDEKE